jgi:outer membrane lipopolysaccharide assembly protein LptE/RlpB
LIRPRPRAVVAALAVGLVCGACAYTTSTALLPSHLKTVAVPVFENSTVEYNLEQEITDAVIARFVQDNHLKVVSERGADAVIKGKIVSYKNSVFGFSSVARSQEYRVTITISVIFKDLIKNREIFNDPNLVKFSNYYVTNVPGDTARTELDGRKAAIAKIADEILNRAVESW